MKKYRVLKAYPKPIMNSNRMVTLKPKSTVYLKYEKQLDRLMLLGYIKEIPEMKKREQSAPAPEEQTKQLVQPKKPKAKYQEAALADTTGE
jgi:hypothetical protein